MNILIIPIVVNLFVQYSFGQTTIDNEADNVPSNRVFEEEEPVPRQLCQPQTPPKQLTRIKDKHPHDLSRIGNDDEYTSNQLPYGMNGPNGVFAMASAGLNEMKNPENNPIGRPQRFPGNIPMDGFQELPGMHGNTGNKPMGGFERLHGMLGDPQEDFISGHRHPNRVNPLKVFVITSAEPNPIKRKDPFGRFEDSPGRNGMQDPPMSGSDGFLEVIKMPGNNQMGGLNGPPGMIGNNRFGMIGNNGFNPLGALAIASSGFQPLINIPMDTSLAQYGNPINNAANPIGELQEKYPRLNEMPMNGNSPTGGIERNPGINGIPGNNEHVAPGGFTPLLDFHKTNGHRPINELPGQNQMLGNNPLGEFNGPLGHNENQPIHVNSPIGGVEGYLGLNGMPTNGNSPMGGIGKYPGVNGIQGNNEHIAPGGSRPLPALYKNNGNRLINGLPGQNEMVGNNPSGEFHGPLRHNENQPTHGNNPIGGIGEYPGLNGMLTNGNSPMGGIGRNSERNGIPGINNQIAPGGFRPLPEFHENNGYRPINELPGQNQMLGNNPLGEFNGPLGHNENQPLSELFGNNNPLGDFNFASGGLQPINKYPGIGRNPEINGSPGNNEHIAPGDFRSPPVSRENDGYISINELPAQNQMLGNNPLGEFNRPLGHNENQPIHGNNPIGGSEKYPGFNGMPMNENSPMGGIGRNSRINGIPGNNKHIAPGVFRPLPEFNENSVYRPINEFPGQNQMLGNNPLGKLNRPLGHNKNLPIHGNSPIGRYPGLNGIPENNIQNPMIGLQGPNAMQESYEQNPGGAFEEIQEMPGYNEHDTLGEIPKFPEMQQYPAFNGINGKNPMNEFTSRPNGMNGKFPPNGVNQHFQPHGIKRLHEMPGMKPMETFGMANNPMREIPGPDRMQENNGNNPTGGFMNAPTGMNGINGISKPSEVNQIPALQSMLSPSINDFISQMMNKPMGGGQSIAMAFAGPQHPELATMGVPNSNSNVYHNPLPGQTTSNSNPNSNMYLDPLFGQTTSNSNPNSNMYLDPLFGQTTSNSNPNSNMYLDPLFGQTTSNSNPNMYHTPLSGQTTPNRKPSFYDDRDDIINTSLDSSLEFEDSDEHSEVLPYANYHGMHAYNPIKAGSHQFVPEINNYDSGFSNQPVSSNQVKNWQPSNDLNSPSPRYAPSVDTKLSDDKGRC